MSTGAPQPCDLAVIGAGPAGMAAALEADALGLSVTLLDDNPAPGGQIYRGLEQHPDQVPDEHGEGREAFALRVNGSGLPGLKHGQPGVDGAFGMERGWVTMKLL